MTLHGTGRGKLILFGEHAAVWGYPAAGIPLPCRLELVRRPDDSGTPPNGFNPIDESDTKSFSQLLDGIESITGYSVGKPDRWFISSDVPRIGGFGSSAALCTALAMAALGRPDRAGYSPEVHRLANELEKYFHGTPSGIDTGMASDNSPALWHREKPGIPRREKLSIPRCFLAVGGIPRSRSTAETVGTIHTAMKNGDPATGSALGKLGNLALDFAGLCRDEAPGFPVDTGRLAQEAQQVLSSLGLSTPEMDRVLDTAMEAGALGGKMSGGGSGGAYWLVFPDEETRSSAIAGMEPELPAGSTGLFPLTTG